MSDVKIQWDTARAVGDWLFGTGDLQTGVDIESAVLVSLFTDRIASPDFKPTDGTNNRRGWWGDTYQDEPLGSRLWQLERAKKSDATQLRLRATDYCKEALEWLVRRGIAASVDVKVRWQSADALDIQVTVTEPQNTKQHPFRYSWAWAG